MVTLYSRCHTANVLIKIRFSVAAAVMLYFPVVLELCLQMFFIYSKLPFGSMWAYYITIGTGPLYLLLPIAPLALELPQYVQPKLLLLVSTVSWFVVPRPQVLDDLLSSLFYITLFIASLYLIRRLNRPGLPNLGTKLGVNVMYFVSLPFPVFSSAFDHTFDSHYLKVGSGRLFTCMILTFMIADFMFGIAALLYGIAKAKRHPLVSSSLLGGTGVEAMVLTLPRSGIPHQSVGDEAGEGAIRL
ncbi:hypothetical protein HBI56_046640 [Parastagonospora nodorum]|nr:hypothetical protein HBH53_018380 [Parastagonospora nodorum]KAH3965369.1 hypothetical protein HBH51_152450 [Parastagonospora nodorum]KAH3977187.1 hypothetical protein HBH52_112780 [Parastagonospora nodorum]KAH3999860.1 hypothetical protein HBI10_108960 [Parastagonospora nodorum]KAH4022259.1 hypothetical protein HBI13_100210 [Parastagonospora nodorum]